MDGLNKEILIKGGVGKVKVRGLLWGPFPRSLAVKGRKPTGS